MSFLTVQNDRALDIATGNNRKTKQWKNKAVLWSGLLDRLARTTRTPETAAEFRAMSRSRQSDIKDVGGFVGGYCKDGSRSRVAHRSILCLDADFADGDLWGDWLLLYGSAAAIYSTHKHTAAKPRLRLIIPLGRNVNPEEYQAIGRRVADTLGIEKFDDTTYQPQRVMFWPSTSQDGEYVFEHLDAPFLDPDTVLATYHDWHDVSSWPMSSRVAEIARRAAARQQDPTAKAGLVGAFCRAYSITETIEQFIPTYEACDEPGRYTYTEGSTAAGVVTYEDKFSYSHHATDPASGQLCNAWDLVRLHRFGELDADCDPDTAAGSRPSYREMALLAKEDSRVKAQLMSDRTAEAAADYADAPEQPTEEDWTSRLKFTEKGTLAQTIENTVLILENDPALRGCLAVNELEHSICTLRTLPWREVGGCSAWSDADDAQLRLYLERVYRLNGKERIFDAVNIVAADHAFHPVRDYLDACTWDGIPRVDTLLIDYLGAADTPYTRAVTRKTLTAAVARIYSPGCKFDYMLTLRGRQGIGKSALIAKLGGEWFSDSFTTLQGKEAYEQVMGVWIMEVGELAGMRKAETEAIKMYISKQTDRFRPAYGRRTQEFPRQCIFIGTTNEAQFLRDSTGNRRFWVVDTPEKAKRDLWAELTPETVQRIWAEAVEIYRKGEQLFLPKELEATAREIQSGYEEENPRAGLIADYLDRLLPEGWDSMDLYARRDWLSSGAVGTRRRQTVCTLEIWAEALGGNPDRLDRYTVKEIREVLDALPEWNKAAEQGVRIPIYGRQRLYKRRKEA